MPHYMLDTDTVSFALRGQGRVAARLLEHRPSELCISSITLAELRFGAEARRSRKLHRLIRHVRRDRGGCLVRSVRCKSLRHSRGRTGSTRRADRHVRHPHGCSCPFVAADVRHEQYPALQERRGARDRKLVLTPWAAEQQAGADGLRRPLSLTVRRRRGTPVAIDTIRNKTPRQVRTHVSDFAVRYVGSSPAAGSSLPRS